jgi:hypothetical protein
MDNPNLTSGLCIFFDMLGLGLKGNLGIRLGFVQKNSIIIMEINLDKKQTQPLSKIKKVSFKSQISTL